MWLFSDFEWNKTKIWSYGKNATLSQIIYDDTHPVTAFRIQLNITENCIKKEWWIAYEFISENIKLNENTSFMTFNTIIVGINQSKEQPIVHALWLTNFLVHIVYYSDWIILDEKNKIER